MCVHSGLLILSVLLFLMILLTLGIAQDEDNEDDIGCYINADVGTFAENDKLTFLMETDSAEACIKRCKGNGASIAGVKWLKNATRPGMCSCLALRPEAQIYKVSCCEGRSKLKIPSFQYKAYNISINGKQINSTHFSSANRNALCEGRLDGINLERMQIRKINIEKYSTRQVSFKLALTDENQLMFCPNIYTGSEKEEYVSVSQTFDAFFIPAFQNASKMCKLHCDLKSRFTKHIYKYFTVTTDKDLNLEFCECFRDSSIVIRQIQQCSHCHTDKKDSCFFHNFTSNMYHIFNPNSDSVIEDFHTETTTSNNINSTIDERPNESRSGVVAIVTILVVIIVKIWFFRSM